ncbi:TetR/AcrR family transcriptional regulator [Streptomyces sp. NPDC002851]
MESATQSKQHRGSRPRADALRNRERIVAAAREMFVESGADVPLDEVARRAGVGNATLYRHFPDRDELVREVVCSVLDRTSERARQALDAAGAADGDAFEALRAFAHAAVEERIGALCPMLSGTFEADHPDLVTARERLAELLDALMGRARAAGQLRTDVAAGDLMVALHQLTRPLPGAGCPNFDQFVRRHLQVFLDGLRAPARSELPGAAATLADLRRSECDD